jgi:hypothetical protein
MTKKPKSSNPRVKTLYRRRLEATTLFIELWGTFLALKNEIPKETRQKITARLRPYNYEVMTFLDPDFRKKKEEVLNVLT